MKSSSNPSGATGRQRRGAWHAGRRLALLLAALVAPGALAPVHAAPSSLLPPDVAKAGKITFCSFVDLPPVEFMDASEKPVGSDVELAQGIASRLGVTADFNNMPFAGLIPALLAGHCDAIISQLFIKPPREKVINFIPYMYSHEVILLKKGTTGIDSLADLSGKKVAAVTGTTATNLLEDENAELKTAGKPLIDMVMFPESTPALQQLQFGQVTAYGVAFEAAAYYAHKEPELFVTGGKPYYKILTGIGLRKDETQLQQAMATAFAQMRKDGSYHQILVKWDIEQDELPQDQ
ncbi:MAG TPA: ABC transporter substrate-binding protein [Stellaceae bacterium]|nr:ABC transporter substrate-binding protein [Stellaceae bacterium]